MKMILLTIICSFIALGHGAEKEEIPYRLRIPIMANGCPKHWIPSNENCYIISHSAGYWQDSLDYCDGWGASRLKIESIHDNKHLESILPAGDPAFFLGLMKTFNDTDYKWDDNSKLIYNNWFKTPLNHEECTPTKTCPCIGIWHKDEESAPSFWYKLGCDEDIHRFACYVPRQRMYDLTESEKVKMSLADALKHPELDPNNGCMNECKHACKIHCINYDT
jgi:Lectin C-type domain